VFVSIQALNFAFKELKANNVSSLATFFTGIKRVEFLECNIVPSSVLEAVESFKELGRIDLRPNHHDQACAKAAVLATCSAAQQHKGGKRKHLNILGSLANRVDKVWKTISCFCGLQDSNLFSIVFISSSLRFFC
jgi:hypothetical protein